MKLNKIFSFLLIVAAFAMVACENETPTPKGPGNGGGNCNEQLGDIITVAQAIANQDLADAKTVQGYVVGWYSSHINDKKVVFSAEGTADTTVIVSNIVIADEATCTDAAKCLCVQLPQGRARTICNLKDNPDNLGKEIKVKGLLQKYNTMAGLKEITFAEVNGKSTEVNVETAGDGSEDNPYTVADVIALGNAKTGNYYVKGFIVGDIKANAQKLEGNIELANFTSNTNIIIAATADETDVANMLPVQLPAGEVRDGLNLLGNPTNAGQEVVLYGSLEAYFGTTGVKNVTKAKMGDLVLPKPPVVYEDALLQEDLLTRESFDKFIIVNVKGDSTWIFSFQVKNNVTTVFGAKMSGYDDLNKKTDENEDWLISPAFDASNGACLTFDHARGPKQSMTVSTAGFTVWVSNDFDGDITTATWTQIAIPKHGTTAWGYVNSGEMMIPEANRKPNCRIAWKYVCNASESATWELKNVLVRVPENQDNTGDDNTGLGGEPPVEGEPQVEGQE